MAEAGTQGVAAGALFILLPNLGLGEQWGLRPLGQEGAGQCDQREREVSHSNRRKK